MNDKKDGIHKISWKQVKDWMILNDMSEQYINKFQNEVVNKECYWFAVSNEKSFTNAYTFFKKIKLKNIIWGNNYNYVKDQRLKDVKRYFPNAYKLSLESVCDKSMSHSFIFHIYCKNYIDIIYAVSASNFELNYMYKLFTKKDDWYDVEGVKLYDLNT